MQLITPGNTIGIIGGGQLGRMTALAAANLGYKSHIYCPDPDSPAFQVTPYYTVASYTDAEQLSKFAEQVAVITFEFENIPYQTVELLSKLVPVRPGWNSLYIAQNRLREKQFVNSLGIATAKFMPITSYAALQEISNRLDNPFIIKTCEQGYDGKGQLLIKSADDLKQAMATFSANGQLHQELIAEAYVNYSREISVIVARNEAGALATFPPSENIHSAGILATTTVPANINAKLASQAEDIGKAIAEQLGLIGLLTVEMFVTPDNQLLVNEIAPRPHNSGHWTIDACVTSQFEQLVRAICGLNFGSVRQHSKALMKNLIGQDSDNWQSYLNDPSNKLHIYGKKESKPGRKMGHVTKISEYDVS